MLYTASVPKTMHWRTVPNTVIVSVNTDVAPSDEEWDEYLEEVTQIVHDIKGVLVYTPSVGPTAAQRARSNEAFKASKAQVKTSIMTGSRMVRGIVTALSWAITDKIKAFPTEDFNSAAEFLELTDEEKLRTRVVLKQLARAANVTVDAFADESGQFRRKYGD